MNLRILLIAVVVFALGCQFGCASLPSSVKTTPKETAAAQESATQQKAREQFFNLIEGLLIQSLLK